MRATLPDAELVPVFDPHSQQIYDCKTGRQDLYTHKCTVKKKAKCTLFLSTSVLLGTHTVLQVQDTREVDLPPPRFSPTETLQQTYPVHTKHCYRRQKKPEK